MKNNKNNNEYFFLYVVFYMICRGFRFNGAILEKIMDFFARIIPERWQTSTFKNAKFRHGVVSNEHEFGLNIVFSNYVMVCGLMGLCFPIGVLINNLLKSIGINSDLILIGLWGCSYFVVNPICENLFVEFKYLKWFKEFDKKNKAWKIFWAFISFLFLLVSYFGSFYLIARLSR